MSDGPKIVPLSHLPPTQAPENGASNRSGSRDRDSGASPTPSFFSLPLFQAISGFRKRLHSHDASDATATTGTTAPSTSTSLHPTQSSPAQHARSKGQINAHDGQQTTSQPFSSQSRSSPVSRARTMNLLGFSPTLRPESRIMDPEIADDIRLLLPGRHHIVRDWTLLYGLAQDGASLTTLYRNCHRLSISGRGQRNGFVIAVRDSNGDIFGAYLTHAPTPSSHFYGSSNCFLWKSSLVHPAVASPPVLEKPERSAISNSEQLQQPNSSTSQISPQGDSTLKQSPRQITDSFLDCARGDGLQDDEGDEWGQFQSPKIDVGGEMASMDGMTPQDVEREALIAATLASLPPPPSADTTHAKESTTSARIAATLSHPGTGTATTTGTAISGGAAVPTSSHSTLPAPAPTRQFKSFPYTGANDYVIYCQNSYLSVGGGDGRYGLWLNESLSAGASDTCRTFENEPLSAEGQRFGVLGVELWYVGVPKS